MVNRCHLPDTAYIRLGDEFLIQPDYTEDGITRPPTREEYVPIVDKYIGSYDVILTKAKNALESRVNQLVSEFVADNTNPPHDSFGWHHRCDHFDKIYRKLDQDLSETLISAFKLGSYQGHEEGKRFLYKIWGGHPRSARLYAFERVEDASSVTLAPQLGKHHRALRIRVQSTGERDSSHNINTAMVEYNLKSLTEKIFLLIKTQTKDALDPFQEETNGPRSVDPDAIERFFKRQKRCVFRKVEEQEIWDEVVEQFDYVLWCVFRLGQSVGWESGQEKLKREYGFYPIDRWIYYFGSESNVDGIIVSKEAQECTCNDCPMCIGACFVGR